tara:strand:+ start:1344 stop:1601 length:258 start_codon:yes stop_codon:yes gene_type:complete
LHGYASTAPEKIIVLWSNICQKGKIIVHTISLLNSAVLITMMLWANWGGRCDSEEPSVSSRRAVFVKKDAVKMVLRLAEVISGEN